MKKPKFRQWLVVGKEEEVNGEAYDVVLGSPDRLTELDAENGDYLAIYKLVAIHQFKTNPRLVK